MARKGDSVSEVLHRPGEEPDEWDFYPGRVDDAPASIMLNLWFRKVAPIRGFDTVYVADYEMVAPADHGMGAPEEAERMQPIEDALTAAAKALGLYHVGRLRNHGAWQIAFYGCAGLKSQFDDLVEDALDDAGGGWLAHELESPDWHYYLEFLCPDAERWQWMKDRSVIEQLEKHGDNLKQPRPVAHWIYFKSAEARDAFETAVRRENFDVSAHPDEAPDDTKEFPHRSHVERVDSVQLNDLHAVVWDLRLLAEQHGGDYDGWETQVVRAED